MSFRELLAILSRIIIVSQPATIRILHDSFEVAAVWISDQMRASDSFGLRLCTSHLLYCLFLELDCFDSGTLYLWQRNCQYRHLLLCRHDRAPLLKPQDSTLMRIRVL